MGKVLIIKNNDKNSEIYSHANNSYATKEKGYYNTVNDSPNEKYLKTIKNKFDVDGL